MTTEPEDFDTEDETEESNDMRNLRRQAKEAKQLKAEVEQLRQGERELAFYRAGLKPEDLSTPVGKLFASAYAGDLTADAIASSWSELGGNPAPEPDEIPAEEQQATTQRQALATGASGDTGVSPPKPVRGEEGAAVMAGRAALAGGAARDDAMGATFRALTDAAAQGNRDVILPFGGESQP